jgi:hypothetical protein
MPTKIVNKRNPSVIAIYPWFSGQDFFGFTVHCRSSRLSIIVLIGPSSSKLAWVGYKEKKKK